MLQIVVPLAGRGSRFTRAGYDLPKPLIDVGGRPMIDVVIDNLRPRRPHRFVFVVQAEQIRDFDLDVRLREWAPGCDVVGLDHLTQGAACTVLTTRDLLDLDQPLMTANCDQWVDMDIDRYLEHFDGSDVDGFLMTMPADDAKWSYAEVDDRGWVRRVVEKQVISRTATVGVYNWSRAGDFLHHADAMIAADRRVNGEFYIAPVYTEQIAAGGHIEVFDVDADGQAMWGLGTPEDLTAFLGGPRGNTKVATRPGR